MAVKIVYFAWVRERVGLAEEEVTPPAGVADVAALVEWLATRSDGHRAAFADPARLRAAVDQAFVPLDAPIAGAREVAIFPPVTGG
ncbi:MULTISPECIES: molybdopterin converting factor subunit 1 [Sphingomonas]|uniref:Molybdopterin synthase sulfur carrier subunit n=1 Tax=Sphingomonas adhaesiva TaxID=28212 RepID=A0A2A4IA77_9SPHN|nr:MULTISPECIES: molybdopterin converting factor subunit 1 [Sphingomonas]PCG15375.1 molybdopterin synthase sulfur carrier subunit [Sphingomonas adhaesiva]PZU81423.1 MAG: molybdopterin converting factor subunit 1 [Sphingomonas sp.]